MTELIQQMPEALFWALEVLLVLAVLSPWVYVWRRGVRRRKQKSYVWLVTHGPVSKPIGSQQVVGTYDTAEEAFDKVQDGLAVGWLVYRYSYTGEYTEYLPRTEPIQVWRDNPEGN